MFLPYHPTTRPREEPLLSFQGTLPRSEAILRLEEHLRMDQIEQAENYFNMFTGRGCAVGCTLHTPSGNHEEYEIQLGYPIVLGFLIDHIFEGLSPADAPAFALRSLKDVPFGVELAPRVNAFFYTLLTDPEWGIVGKLGHRFDSHLSFLQKQFSPGFEYKDLGDTPNFEALHSYISIDFDYENPEYRAASALWGFNAMSFSPVSSAYEHIDGILDDLLYDSTYEVDAEGGAKNFPFFSRLEELLFDCLNLRGAHGTS